MHTNEERHRLRTLHARSVRLSTDIVARVTPDQLDNETPCAAWHLRELLAHMSTENSGFAAAARGAGEAEGLWTAREYADPVAAYQSASAEVVAAFADENVFDRPVRLPEIAPGFDIPAESAIGFHLVDSVVHAWDVASAIGVTVPVDHELAAEALRIARAVPDDEGRLLDGAAFAPALAAADDQPVLDQILRLLGRSPTWPQG
ncbi:TIGR03086 family metal-binding protein [Nocardia callitridis]|uniref:Mycothiol-dependent maleylpyruvate isomerase metal-binding domain-containing protein n=1 Tax=Nocardia callitridis TaxID=648753 RepID=A0ABP9KW00_9NOCA